jgi:hypothetical protein
MMDLYGATTHNRRVFRSFILALPASILIACGGDKPPVDPPDAGGGEDAVVADAEPRLTYYRDIKRIVDAKCVACHLPGGVGPLDLSDPEVVKQVSVSIYAEVEQDTMPPWPPRKECGPFLHDRSLTAEHKQAVLDWVVDGAPMGDPANTGEPIPPDLGGLTRIDETLRVEEAYEPHGGDDYRCFVIDWPAAEEKYLTGFNIVPSEPRILHHVNIFSTDLAGSDAFRMRDQMAAGPGYPCFGGAATEPGVALLGAWAPGSLGIEYPAGTGLALVPGSVVVIEAHYSTPEGQGLADQLQMDIQFEATVEKRALILAFWDFEQWSRQRNMDIPANEPDVMHSVTLDPNGGLPLVAPWIRGNRLSIHGAGIHMHHLGSYGKLMIRHGMDGSGGESCLLSIPDWDFHWQSGYLFETPQEFVVGQDIAYLECHWDNTEANQPIVNGERRPVRDVNWGGSSNDEMCIGYAYVTEK